MKTKQYTYEIKKLKHKILPNLRNQQLGISLRSLEEMVDLSEIQNAANTKTHSPYLSNEDFHILKNPKISSPINHKTKNTHFSR